jgi:heat shock protein HslJ
VKLAIGLTTTAILMACSNTPAAAVFALDGTTWRLTEISSTADQQDSTIVPAEQPYALTFNAESDGMRQATFRIDCNRGTSTWQAEPDTSGTAGRLVFGELTVTEMACPPGSLDHHVIAALDSVRQFQIRDGRLHLSPDTTDSSTLTWEPAG